MRDLHERLSRLESRRGLNRPVCSECGTLNGGVVIMEEHKGDATVSYDPHPPCKGCDEIAFALGLVNRVVICSHLASCAVCLGEERGA